MKRKLTLRTVLAAAMMAVGLNSAWADDWSAVWTTDFSSAPTGMTYSMTGSNASVSISDGHLLFSLNNAGGGRTPSVTFTDDAFNVDTNWKLEFDWSCVYNNSNSNIYFATNSGNIFKIEWNATNAVITDYAATPNTLTSTLPHQGAYSSSNTIVANMTSPSHFTINGVKDDGIYLTVTKGGTTYVNNVKVSSAFSYPKSFGGTLARYYSSFAIDNITFSTPKIAGYVAPPAYVITAPDGTNRKFTLSCLTENTTIYYATSDLAIGADGWTVYPGEAVSTAATTIYAYAKDEDGNTSEKTNFDTGAGTALTLNTPTISKTAYSDGAYTVSLTSDQSGLSLVPASTTLYYTVDGGDATAYTAAFAVAAGSTVTAYAASTGYTNSSIASSTTTARPNITQDWTQDYTAVTSSAGTGAQAVTISASADFTVGERAFYNITGYGETSVSLNANVGINTSTGFSLRCNGVNSGILKNSDTGGSTGYIGLQNLTAGQYIFITTNGNALSAEAGVELLEGMSTTSEYVFRATDTKASILFPHGTYNYVKAITVYSPMPTLADGSAVRLTFDNAMGGTNNWDNWVISFYNASGTKVAQPRADWYDDVAGNSTGFTYGYTYSSDGGTTADNTNVWSTFGADMADADIDLTLTNSEGTLYVIGTMTKDDKVYYVNFAKSGISGTLSYNLYGNNATLSNIATADASVTTTPAHPAKVTVAIGGNGYATYANNVYPLNLTGAAAYKAAVSKNTVTFTAFNQNVPVSTGMLVEGTANGTVNLPIADASSAVDGNAFLVNTTNVTINSNESTYYFAMLKDSNPLKFGKVTGVAIPATKAYLAVPATNFAGGAPSLTAIFDGGNTTGINTVKNSQFTDNGEYYNLAGQRVAQPTKGLYIVNGRKVVVK